MITLQSLGPDQAGHGTFAVNVDGVDTGARVKNGVPSLVVHRGGIGVTRPDWTAVSHVVAWLESDAGRDWLREAVGDSRWRPLDAPSEFPATSARPSRCPDDEFVDPGPPW
ncbi:MAG TPA: hypothetical protein VF506_00845 [Streptosporangiaceae bacterium]